VSASSQLQNLPTLISQITRPPDEPTVGAADLERATGREDKANRQGSCRRAPRVYVIILNWNGWRDTLACLESVLLLDYDNLCVVVCDNGSTDDSVTQILNWAKAQLPARIKARPLMSSMVTIDALAARAGPMPDGNLILLQNHENLGFAGGNNAGLKFALARGDFDYAWLLNNDTVVERSSLTYMVEKMQSSRGAGICGSTLLYGHDPERHVRGAVYSKWFARTRLCGSPAGDQTQVDEDAYARKIDYVVGASMLVRKAFLEDIGLMSEEYFLYFEELDWMLRARPNYGFAHASRSLVHHKGGAATGATRVTKSVIGEYYGTRSRILFTRKFYPHALPTVVLAILVGALTQCLKGRFKLAITTVTGARDGVRGRTGVRPK
jgi:GT2 family glycosyltransferase